MAIQKSKTLSNGAAGNYWKIEREVYDKVTLLCTWFISLYCDATHAADLTPSLGLTKVYTYTANLTELAGDRTALGYTQIKAQAAASVPNLVGGGTHTFDPDLVGGIDV